MSASAMTDAARSGQIGHPAAWINDHIVAMLLECESARL
jgi:hypothetical protein